MTNEELKVILDEHKQWIESFGLKGKRADLYGANLRRADLRRADLYEANLRRADLHGANLYEANLHEANLHGANLNNAMIENHCCPINCPEEGSFIAFKKARIPHQFDVIVKLEIPEDAKRHSATTRKCRCNKAKVLSITSLDGNETFNYAISKYDHSFKYEVGDVVEVVYFDENRWNECSTGIHFFITRDEAVNY